MGKTHHPKLGSPGQNSDEADLTKLDRRVEEAVKRDNPEGWKEVWDEYRCQPPDQRKALAETLLDEHRRGHVLGHDYKGDSEDATLAGATRMRKPDPYVPAGHYRSTRGRLRPFPPPDAPDFGLPPEPRVATAAMQLEKLAHEILAGTGRRKQLRVLAAYRAAFGKPPPEVAPWQVVLLARLTEAKTRLLSVADVKRRDRLRDYVDELTVHASVTSRIDRPDGIVELFVDPPHSPTLRPLRLRVRPEQIEETRVLRRRAKPLEQLKLAPLPGEREPSEERIAQFKNRNEPGTVVVPKCGWITRYYRCRFKNADPREPVVGLDEVSPSDIADGDCGIRRKREWTQTALVRVPLEQTAEAFVVRLTPTQSIEARGLTPEAILAGTKRALPRRYPLPAHLDHPQVVQWLLAALSLGRGGGRHGALSGKALMKLAASAEDLAHRIETDPAAQHNQNTRDRRRALARFVRMLPGCAARARRNSTEPETNELA